MCNDIRIDDDKHVRYLERLQKGKLSKNSQVLRRQKPGEEPVIVEKPWEEEIRSVYSDDSRIAPPPEQTALERTPGKRQVKLPDRFKVQAWLENSQGIQSSILPFEDCESSFGLEILFD